MKPLNREGLQALREEKRSELRLRKSADGKVEIIIGMGTSGIAAGARASLAAFEEKVDDCGIKNVLIRQAGSLGLDYAEPTVEVRMHGMPDTIYGNVSPEVAEQIVEQHILKHEMVNKHVYDRPAPDMIKE